MHARPGDHLVIEQKRVGVPARSGEILEVIPGSGGEHYRVRWDDDPEHHESIYYPAPGARIEGQPQRGT